MSYQARGWVAMKASMSFVSASSVMGFTFAGGLIMDRSGNYTRFIDSMGSAAFQAGNSNDPANYHANDTHNFYNRAQTVVFARLNSTGLAVGGVNPLVAKFTSYAADGTYQFGVRGTTMGIRVGTDASKSLIEGVSADLQSSYQPLFIGGSYLGLQANGASIAVISATEVRPAVDNAVTSGAGGSRWSVVYAATGTINTSGRDTKVGIRAPLDAERRAARRILDVGSKLYKFKDAVDAKGEAARLHAGYIAEDVHDALEAEGLDPWAYGFMCADDVTVSEEYTVTVTRPAMQMVTSTEKGVEVIDGRAVLVERQVELDEPKGRYLPVVDTNGDAVMVATGERDENGKPVLVPMTHLVQDVEEVEEIRTRQVPTGEKRLGLRYSELEAFLKAAV